MRAAIFSARAAFFALRRIVFFFAAVTRFSIRHFAPIFAAISSRLPAADAIYRIISSAEAIDHTMPPPPMPIADSRH
jgi:hypothetical protein